MILTHQEKYRGTWPGDGHDNPRSAGGTRFSPAGHVPETTPAMCAPVELTPYERARNALILAEIAERDEEAMRV